MIEVERVNKHRRKKDNLSQFTQLNKHFKNTFVPGMIGKEININKFMVSKLMYRLSDSKGSHRIRLTG